MTITLDTTQYIADDLAIGIDIGGTKIAGGRVDSSGRLHDRHTVSTPSNPREIEDAVVALVQRLSSGHSITAAGVAAAGFIDKARNVILHSPNIPWQNEPLRQRLTERLGIGISLENDANAAGWAEHRFGAARGHTDIIMLTMGTGVGGAVITDGNLLAGARGAAGELGHIRLRENGRPCGCGASGCLEQYASGRALNQEILAVAAHPEIGIALRSAQEATGTISAAQISRLVKEGDTGALQALRHVGSAMGEACAILQTIFDPDVFIIGGGVAELGDPLFQTIRRSFRAALTEGTQHDDKRIVPALLGNDAGIIGAAEIARASTGNRPSTVPKGTVRNMTARDGGS